MVANRGSQKILTPGENFPVWPSNKLLHAQRLGTALNDSVLEWRGRLGRESTTHLAADGLSGIVRARIVEEPPIEEWILLLEDVLHNYRAALDALVWHLAHLDGRVPHEKVRRRIYFPFATSRAEWRRLTRNQLASIPEYALERLHRVQPYHVHPVEKGVALTLHRLDVRGKHRSAIELLVNAVDKQTFAMKLRYHESQAGQSTYPFEDDLGWQWTSSMTGLRDGDEIAKFTSKNRLTELVIDELPLAITILDEGEQLDLWDLLRHIDAQVVATFNIVYLGADTDEHLEFMAQRGLRTGTPSLEDEN